MSLGAWVRRVLRRAPEAPVPADEAVLAAWLPPQEVHDRGAWDEHWRNHLAHKVGAMEQGVMDSMASDTTLPIMLATRGARTILCAGNGCSSEAPALAFLGFHVTVLDLSAVPAEAFRASLSDPEHPMRRIPGFTMRDDGWAFSDTAAIDPTGCPSMHRSAEYDAKRAVGSRDGIGRSQGWGRARSRAGS